MGFISNEDIKFRMNCSCDRLIYMFNWGVNVFAMRHLVF